ncbi:MAG: hypothetical protein HZB19_18900 [Chloroflexi bacterium]|nr:hypothetical protein [Chloroflexota bacterium]
MNLKHFPPRNIFLLLAGLALVAVSLACGAGSAAPAGGATEEPAEAAPESTQPVSVTAVVDDVPTPQPQPAINETRRLTLEFPPQIRLGEGDIVRLTLEVDDLGNVTPTAEIEGNTIIGETVEIPNLYETHNITAEARFDLAGVDVKPADLISEPLTPGQSVTFYWSIRPQEVGVYRGTIWLYLRFVDKSNGEESRKTVSAQMVEIEAVNLLGLPLGVVRTTGAVGSVVGGILGFPFLEDIVKFLFRRRKRV